jgi:ssRNA-specific RNase YbeY (16S rRNA maturation enzyme)
MFIIKNKVMAEIKIEKKKPIWPWIVAVLLISALIYFVFVKHNESKDINRETIENNTSTDTLQNN